MPAGRRTPISRRDRPAKPALSRDGIVATALAVLRAEGLERVTMRRLAQELDTGPASLYVYVANTAELHAAVLDELLGEIDLTGGGATGWRDRLVAVLSSYIMTLYRYPELARSALTVRPNGEHYLRLLETLLALLTEGGVPAGQAAWGVDVLLLVATASAAEHATRDEAGTTEAEWSAVAAALHGVSGETHPHVHALAADLLAGPPKARMTWAFHMLINGIAHTVTPEMGTAFEGGTT